MEKHPSVGDKVKCRFYNIRKGVFYGEEWESEVIEISHGITLGTLSDHILVPYKVKLPVTGYVWLMRKEIIGVVG